jgi:hypothetical protein
MKLIVSSLIALCLALGIPEHSAAQSVSAPGWNQIAAKPGELRFKHISGKGLVSVFQSDALPDDIMEDFLLDQLAKLDAAGKCPGGKYGSVRQIREENAWKAYSYNDAAHCTILVGRHDKEKNKIFVISAFDVGEDWIATGRFAEDLLDGLSGKTKRDEDKKKAEEAAELARNPPIVRPTAIPNSSKIIAVFYDNTRQQTNWTPGLNTMVQSTEFFEDSEVLFADGTACKDCMEDWTNDPALTRYRTENPNDIGKWTKVSGGFSIRYPDSDAAIIKPNADNVRPVLTGKRFNNYVLESVTSSTIGTGFSLTQNMRTDTIFLGADGKFSWGFEGSSVRQNIYGGYTNSKGEYVSLSGPSAGPTESGRYSVSDYGIKLEYSSGKTEVLSLLTFPKSPDFLIIDGMGFIPKKDE